MTSDDTRIIFHFCCITLNTSFCCLLDNLLYSSDINRLKQVFCQIHTFDLFLYLIDPLPSCSMAIVIIATFLFFNIFFSSNIHVPFAFTNLNWKLHSGICHLDLSVCLLGGCKYNGPDSFVINVYPAVIDRCLIVFLPIRFINYEHR